MRELIDRFHGGAETLVALWNMECPATARDIKTYYSWLKSGVPATPAGFSLFRILDIDPVALTDHEAIRLGQRFASVRAALMGTGQAALALKSLAEPILPDINWPSDKLLDERMGKTWCRHVFHHNARSERNAMACITVRPTGSDFHPALPRAWYIAYRHADGWDCMWRPYGILVRKRGINFLLTSRGQIQADDRFPHQSLMMFGTEFGEGPADFCLSSMHPFEIQVEFPSLRACHLRFPP